MSDRAAGGGAPDIAAPDATAVGADAPDAAAPASLADVRASLRDLGYLDHRVERFLLQDALRPNRAALRSVLLLGLKVGVLGGSLVALVSTLVLATINDVLLRQPFDLLPLFLHLAPPLIAFGALAFLPPVALLALVLRLSHTRRIEAVCFALALISAAGGVLAALAGSRALIASATPWQVAALAVVLPLLAYALMKIVHGGLLSLAIQLTDRGPERAPAPWLWSGLAVAVAVVLVLLPAVLDVRGGPSPPPPSLPTAPGARVLLIGIDGVLAQEFDYLLATGALPALAALRDDGGRVVDYARRRASPATVWTTVATGVSPSTHGVVDLDGYRPRGMRSVLLRTGWLRPYFERVERPLGLADHRPVLAGARRAFTVWELAARGGPALAVGWWGTFPAAATEVNGLVVAHGAYGWLAERAATDDPAAIVAPPDEAARLWRGSRAALAGDPALTRFDDGVQRALPADEAARVLDRALRPDRFYRWAFADAFARLRPRAAALYLAAPDILADRTTAALGSTVQGAMIERHLRATDAMLGALLAQDARAASDSLDGDGRPIGTVAIVVDPGRRADDAGATIGGRVLLWRRAGCRTPAAAIAPDATDRAGPAAVTLGSVAGLLLRDLGLPQSDAVAAPDGCAVPPPSLRVRTYGTRTPRAAAAPVDDAYLRQLRSLGYL